MLHIEKIFANDMVMKMNDCSFMVVQVLQQIRLSTHVSIEHLLVSMVNDFMNEFECNHLIFLGVKYGHGVYFHTQASYSHQYAMKNITGERTVFLVRVLIGRTCQGNSSMKVTPNGYDTTTDGEDIFVVYHDAGAYAEYLITYRGE